MKKQILETANFRLKTLFSNFGILLIQFNRNNNIFQKIVPHILSNLFREIT